MPCTTILVGKKASFDGSTLVARNEDSPTGIYNPKKYVVVQPSEQPRVYKSVLSHVEIPLPDEPMRYTCMPHAIDKEGIWGSFGVNTANVSMSATETITSNERVLAADPLVKYVAAVGKEGDENYIPEQVGGIGEEDFVTLLLPYMRTAREGVIRLGELLEKCGTYEMSGIAFQDVNEIWWLETIGGHHWIAKRVPDDCYVIMPNQFGIDDFDLHDAFGAQKNHLCSKDLKQFIEKYHLDLSLNGTFNARLAFGSRADSDHIYNTPRAWILQRYLNPRSNVWDGCNADFTPYSDDIPWARVPERKITVEDVKYVLSHHFQGTPYDPYGKYGDLSQKGQFRSIGINRNGVLGLVQIRPYMPEAIRSLEWIALGSNVFNAMIPFYVNIDKTPDYLANTSATVTTDNFYWTNRIVGALADAHYHATANTIEFYQNDLQSKCMELINKYDAQILEKGLSYADAAHICEEANEAIAEEARKQTQGVLNDVLYIASNTMKNCYLRTDD